MEPANNPKNPKFIEDLQKASQELEVSLQRKKPIFSPQSEEFEEKPKPSEKSFEQDLIIQAGEISKEKKRLEEIQRNLERNQKIVADYIQELTTIQGEISRVLEGKKKIDEDLKRMREKNQKIFKELEGPDSLQSSKQESR